jgi:hypothetical protein
MIHDIDRIRAWFHPARPTMQFAKDIDHVAVPLAFILGFPFFT